MPKARYFVITFYAPGYGRSSKVSDILSEAQAIEEFLGVLEKDDDAIDGVFVTKLMAVEQVTKPTYQIVEVPDA